MRALAAAFLAIGLTGPAAAQDRMSTDTCAASWTLLSDAAAWSDEVIRHDAPRATDDGWCGIADLRWTGAFALEVQLIDLRWRLGDPARLIEEGLPPRSIEVKVGRVATWPDIGNAVRNYAYRLQGPQFEGSAALRLQWDGVAKALTLQDLSLDFGDLGALKLSARASGVDLSDREAMMRSTASVALETVTLEVTANGFPERYLAVPLAEALLDPEGPPPEAQVARLIASAKARLADLDESLLPPRSRTALEAALDSLPRPRGTLRVQMQAQEPLPIGKIVASALAMPPQDAVSDMLVGHLEQLRLGVNWSPQRGAE